MSLRVILTQSTPAPAPQLLGDPLPSPDPDPCAACADKPCENVPAGELHLLVCDGKTVSTLKGTVEGQVPMWDNTAKKFKMTLPP